MTEPSSERVVVLGGNLSALRAAVALARSGHSVVLFEPGSTPGGSEPSPLPLDRGLSFGLLPVAPSLGSTCEHLVPLAEPPSRGFSLRGRQHPLPPGLRDLPHLVPADRLPRAALAWIRARAASRDTGVLGLWSERRTWRDQAVQAFGEPVVDALLASWCERRWGEPSSLAAAMGQAPEHSAGRRWLAPSEGPAAEHRRLISILQQEKVEIRTGFRLDGFILQEGRVARLRLREGSRRTTASAPGRVFLSASPARVLRWLGGGVSSAILADAQGLHLRHTIQVMTGARGQEQLPFETHLLDIGRPFYRMLRPELLPGCSHLGGGLLFEANLEPEDPLWTAPDAELLGLARDLLPALGLGDNPSVEPILRRVEDHEPIWSPTWHPRWMRTLNHFHGCGLRLVGRAGAFAPLDEAAEWELLAAMLAVPEIPIREIHRIHVDPPVPRTLA